LEIEEGIKQLSKIFEKEQKLEDKDTKEEQGEEKEPKR
jgi:hypothetical protein